MTCKGEKYLKLPASYARKGTCANKTVLNTTSPMSTKELNMVVLNVGNFEVKDRFKTDPAIQ